MDPTISMRAATASELADIVPLIDAYWHFEAIDGFEATRVFAQLHRLVAEPSLGRLWLARSAMGGTSHPHVLNSGYCTPTSSSSLVFVMLT